MIDVFLLNRKNFYEIVDEQGNQMKNRIWFFKSFCSALAYKDETTYKPSCLNVAKNNAMLFITPF